MQNIVSRYAIKRVLLVCFLLFLSGCTLLSTGPDEKSSGQRITDSSTVNGLLNKAIRAEDSGDTEQADSFYQQMMSEGAKSTRSLNRYAVFLRKQFEIDKAETIYLKALAYSPNDANTHYNLAILYELYKGDFAKAKKHFELFQSNSAEPDKKVKAWIADLQRRIAARKQSRS